MNTEYVSPDGYTEVNRETQRTPSIIKVTTIRVASFSDTNGNLNWDTASAPDIFIRLGRGNGDTSTTLIYESNRYDDVLSNSNTHFDFIPESPISINNN